MTEPHFSEQQLAVILRRAAELSTAEERTYSLTEIQHIALQAGISPDLVAQAAADLPLIEAESGSRIWGASAAYHLSRRVAREATANDFAAVLSLVRQRLPEVGDARELGGTFEWRYDTGYSGVAVTIAPIAESTSIRIDARYDGRVFAFYGTAMAAAVITGLIASTFAPPHTAAVVAVGAAVPYVTLARAWWNRTAARAKARLTQLADDITDLLHHRSG